MIPMDRKLYSGVPLSCSLLDFDKYVVNSPDSKSQLYQHIRDCHIDTLRIRCDVWRMAFGIINIDHSWEQKIEDIDAERERYMELEAKHLKKPHSEQKLPEVNPMPKNPLGKLLSQKAVVPPTKQESEDKFLEEEVRKDVERTYQEREFFRNPDIIRILSKVLFIWSKEHPDISYKQGMNEVSASVIYVYFASAVDPQAKYKEYEGIVEELRDKYVHLHSNTFAQPDIYSLFDKLMQSGHQEMFRDTEANKELNPNSKNNSAILQRIIKLTDIKFKMVDNELFRHIKLNEVTMRTFLLRWIRCLHTREFELEDSLWLWDNILLDYHLDPKYGLNFVECTTLAMMIYLRELTLKKDSAFEILQLYQKYPKVQGKHLQEVVNLAWTVKEHLRMAMEKESDKKKDLLFDKCVIGQFKIQQEPEVQRTESRVSQPLVVEAEKNIYPELKQVKQVKKTENKQLNEPKHTAVEERKGSVKIREPKEPQFNIILTYKEWKEVESLMKKSIEENTDLESRSLAMKVLKVFSSKEQQELKKIEESNSYLGKV